MVLYVEPFVGSGAIFINLEKEFEYYIINDSCPNIYCLWIALQECNYYEEWTDTYEEINKRFGSIKDNKQSYYNFRTWYNENYHFYEEYPKVVSDDKFIKKGMYLYFLTNACINSMLRFGPNGMNQGWGNRSFLFSEDDFNFITKKLEKTSIFNEDYSTIITESSNAVIFLDPPYCLRPSSYKHFSEQDIREFIEKLYEATQDNDVIYTDAESDFINLDIFNKFKIRTMKNTAPSKKCISTIDEVCYYNFRS